MRNCRIFFPIFLLASSVLGLDSTVCGPMPEKTGLFLFPVTDFPYTLWATRKINHVYQSTDLNSIIDCNYYTVRFGDSIPYHIEITLIPEKPQSSPSLLLQIPKYCKRSQNIKYTLIGDTIIIENDQFFRQINFSVEKIEHTKMNHNLVLKISTNKQHPQTITIPIVVQ